MTGPPDLPGTSGSIVKSLLAEAAVVGAALYYFGYLRTRAAFGYFGVDASVLKLGTQDYLLRSVNSVGIPLLVAAMIYFAAQVALVAAPRLGLRRLAGPLVPLAAAGVAGALGLGGIAVGQLLGGDQIGMASALLLCVAFLLAGSGARRLRSEELDRVAFAAYAGAVVLLFVAMTGFAGSIGRGDAARFAHSLRDQPAVTLRSADDLGLQGNGVQASTTPSTHYAYRYDGLRLLARTGDQYLFVPPDWHRGVPVFVIPGGSGLRMDITAP